MARPGPNATKRKPRPIAAEKRAISRLFWRDLTIAAALLLATFAVYFQTRQFDFVNFDDPETVSANAHVHAGLTARSVAWAFTSTDSANWFPVTRLSELLDVELFGMRSGWHHLTNVAIHALAALLLFAFLRRAAGAVWASALVAFLFALHPLHVESVAWVSERKDVLSAFFWFLALWGYARYSERPSAGRYWVVVAAFCLGLMSKPMIVTLPLVLLLMDVWPLGRRVSMTAKIPLFALAVASAAATFVVQQHSGAVRQLAAFPLDMRVENALISYAVYMLKTIWPSHLAVFYPYPAHIAAWQVAAASALLAGATVLALRQFRRRPYLAVGWLWFVVTLAPVIGIVQVGAQARADRYMYVPMVGLLIALAWGAREAVGRWPRVKSAAVGLAILACGATIPATWAHVGYWRNSETLFTHAIEATGDNYLAQHNLGNTLLNDPGRLEEAESHLRQAVRLDPDSISSRSDLGAALAKMGRLPEAIGEYQAAIELDPSSAILHHNLGSALVDAGRLAEGMREYEAALGIDANYAEARRDLAAAHYARGMELAKQPGHAAEATVELQAALGLNPDNAEAHNNLGVMLSQIPGRSAEAMAHFQEAVRLRPEYGEARYNLALALADAGKTAEAMAAIEAGLRMEPDPQLQELRERLRSGR